MSAEQKVKRYTFIMTHGFEPDGRVYEVQPKEPHREVHPPNRLVSASDYDELRASHGELREALEAAYERITKTPHGDNCYLSNHYEGDPGNGCNCGKESLVAHMDALISKAPSGDA